MCPGAGAFTGAFGPGPHVSPCTFFTRIRRGVLPRVCRRSWPNLICVVCLAVRYNISGPPSAVTDDGPTNNPVNKELSHG